LAMELWLQFLVIHHHWATPHPSTHTNGQHTEESLIPSWWDGNGWGWFMGVWAWNYGCKMKIVSKCPPVSFGVITKTVVRRKLYQWTEF
jgi:hypothetical protein